MVYEIRTITVISIVTTIVIMISIIIRIGHRTIRTRSKNSKPPGARALARENDVDVRMRKLEQRQARSFVGAFRLRGWGLGYRDKGAIAGAFQVREGIGFSGCWDVARAGSP